MDERLKFVVGQKKRTLNEITARIAKFKQEGKNLGVFLTLEDDGHLRTPRDFVDKDMPVMAKEYSKLTAREKKIYDSHYVKSTTYLIATYNEANKKYNEIFETLDVYDKLDELKEELNALNIEYKRANIYLATLPKQSEERMEKKFENYKKLTDEQLTEINDEITQIKYLEKSINLKTKLYNELKESL